MVEAVEIFEFVKIYKELIEKVKTEKLNPFEIDINQLKELISDDLITNGLIISLLTKILKLKAEYLEKQLIPEEEKEEKIKKVFKQVLQEETDLSEDDIEDLLMIESIKAKLRKPKAVNPPKISYQEFQKITKGEIIEVLYEDTDYNNYAKEIYRKIKNNTFKIRSIQDFIGLMFAIYNYNLNIKHIKSFL